MSDFIMWAFPANLPWYFYIIYVLAFILLLYNIICFLIGMVLIYEYLSEVFEKHLTNLRINRFADSEIVSMDNRFYIFRRGDLWNHTRVWYLKPLGDPKGPYTKEYSIKDVKKLTKAQKLELL